MLSFCKLSRWLAFLSIMIFHQAFWSTPLVGQSKSSHHLLKMLQVLLQSAFQDSKKFKRWSLLMFWLHSMKLQFWQERQCKKYSSGIKSLWYRKLHRNELKECSLSKWFLLKFSFMQLFSIFQMFFVLTPKVSSMTSSILIVQGLLKMC